MARSVEKSRGRLEIRDLWVVEAGDLAPYLEAVWDWRDVQQIAWVRRRRQLHRGERWSEEWVTLVTSLSSECSSADELLHLVRGHWVIENRVHRVRDVSQDEDRNHGRKHGPMMAWVRNTAISVFRWRGFRYVPDGWRFTSAHLMVSLTWLL